MEDIIRKTIINAIIISPVVESYNNYYFDIQNQLRVSSL